MPYSNDPSTTPKDAVRFLIGDTVEPERFNDAEILYILQSQGNNVYFASAVLCEKLTTLVSSGGLSSKSVGGLSESYSQGSVAFYQNQAKVFRALGSVGSAGNIGASAAVQAKIFSMKQFDNPAAGDRHPRNFNWWEVGEKEWWPEEQ